MTPTERFIVDQVEICRKRAGLRKPVCVKFPDSINGYIAMTYKESNTIAFARDWIYQISDYDLVETAMHEVCHLKNKVHGHGRKFKKLCARHGVDSSPYGTVCPRELGWIRMLPMDSWPEVVG